MVSYPVTISVMELSGTISNTEHAWVFILDPIVAEEQLSSALVSMVSLNTSFVGTVPVFRAN